MYVSSENKLTKEQKMSTMTPDQEWVPFKKRTIGKGRGFMTPHENTLKVLFTARNMYMSKKVLRTLGSPAFANVSDPRNDESVCILPFNNEQEGYRIHGVNGNNGQSACIDVSAFIKINNVHPGLYACHLENGRVIFNLREYIPVTPSTRNRKSTR